MIYAHDYITLSWLYRFKICNKFVPLNRVAPDIRALCAARSCAKLSEWRVCLAMHDDVKVTKDQLKKPQVHTFYDHTKGGVDVVDLLSTSHSTRIKSKRWPLNAFAFILDTGQ